MTEVPTDQATRWLSLLSLLTEHERLSVTEASEILGVSAATVRRDFTELERQHLAARTHGGIVSAAVAYDLPARYRVSETDPRERIALAAVERIEGGSAVGLNGCTTTTAVARQIARSSRFETERGHGLTVVTNALNIAADLVLRPHIRTVCIGGEARPES